MIMAWVGGTQCTYWIDMWLIWYKTHAYDDPFCRNAFCSHRSFIAFLSVAHPQDPHHPSEKPVIHCHKCGEPCKGEVLRVQTKHFHIKCFTCKGMVCPVSWLSGVSPSVLALGSAPSPNSTLDHWMISECTQKPRNHLSSLIWYWTRLKGETKSPQDQWCTSFWMFIDVPDPRRGN